MKFHEAMKHVLEDYGKCRRNDWNRVDHIKLIGAEDYKGDRFEFVAIVMKDGKQGPYPPSACDMLADDWVIVE